VTVQARPPPGREHRRKCCVFYKLLFVYYSVAYRMRTALKMTKELEPRSLQARVRSCRNLPSYRIPQSFSNNVCSSLRRARSKLSHVPSYPALPYNPSTLYRCIMEKDVSWGLSIDLFFMLSSLPCFFTFCRSTIPTSCYIFNVFALSCHTKIWQGICELVASVVTYLSG